MNLSKLFELQRQLDEHIEKEHPRQDGEDRLAKKILALQVELGELANEWRGFKFWSKDQSPRIGIPSVHYDENLGHDVVEYVGPNPLLEEFVDCLHFILSIAIELGYTVDDLYVSDNELAGKTEDIFLELMYWVIHIKSTDKQKRKKAFRIVCYIFFNMAEQQLGFTWSEIEQAYMKKNAINHERQNVGY